MNNQNLIWSIFSGMMVAIMLGLGKGILPPVNVVEIKSIGIGGMLMKPVVIRDIVQKIRKVLDNRKKLDIKWL